jgi:integrase
MGVRLWKDSQGRRRYAVEFEQRGHRVFRRLPPGATKEQALQLEARRRHELIDQEVIGKKPNVTIEFAINAWLAEAVKGRKSEKATTSHANRVREIEGGAVAGAALHELPRLAARLRSDAESYGLLAGTVNRRLCILKAVAKFAWRKGWLDENLSGKIQLLPEKKYQRREVTPADARALIDAATSPRAKALIALSAYTGLRLGEVIRLKPADVRGGVIIARDTKNGTDRIIPILPELEPHLEQLPFTAGWRNVYRGFERARKAAKLDIRYHDLRHMVASALARSGEDLRLSMDIMGHKSIETHRRYVHTDMEAKREALERALSPIRPPIRKRAKAKKAA